MQVPQPSCEKRVHFNVDVSAAFAPGLAPGGGLIYACELDPAIMDLMETKPGPCAYCDRYFDAIGYHDTSCRDRVTGKITTKMYSHICVACARARKISLRKVQFDWSDEGDDDHDHTPNPNLIPL
jgi:hypothetical protein